jgi:hypothetical protein
MIVFVLVVLFKMDCSKGTSSPPSAVSQSRSTMLDSSSKSSSASVSQENRSGLAEEKARFYFHGTVAAKGPSGLFALSLSEREHTGMKAKKDKKKDKKRNRTTNVLNAPVAAHSAVNVTNVTN